MNWSILIPIIAQYGIPLAEKLYQKWASGNPPTQQDFEELRAAAKVSEVDIMKSRLAAAGIPLDSPQALALIALVQ